MYLPPGRPQFPLASANDFWGTKLEASPYPRVMVFRDSAPSPSEAYSQALSRLSWLSFSPPGFFARTPEPVAPVPTVTSRKLPTRARLSELERPNPLERIRLCALRINPPPFRPSRPVKPPALRRRLGEGFLRRPFRTSHDQKWDRTHGLLL